MAGNQKHIIGQPASVICLTVFKNTSPFSPPVKRICPFASIHDSCFPFYPQIWWSTEALWSCAQLWAENGIDSAAENRFVFFKSNKPLLLWRPNAFVTDIKSKRAVNWSCPVYVTLFKSWSIQLIVRWSLIHWQNNSWRFRALILHALLSSNIW